MAELKTKETKENPKDFLAAITPEQKQKDSFILLELFSKVTGERPVMWGRALLALGNITINPKEALKRVTGRLLDFLRANKILRSIFGMEMRIIKTCWQN